jgi:hypothetical protein
MKEKKKKTNYNQNAKKIPKIKFQLLINSNLRDKRKYIEEKNRRKKFKIELYLSLTNGKILNGKTEKITSSFEHFSLICPVSYSGHGTKHPIICYYPMVKFVSIIY